MPRQARAKPLTDRAEAMRRRNAKLQRENHSRRGRYSIVFAQAEARRRFQEVRKQRIREEVRSWIVPDFVSESVYANYPNYAYELEETIKKRVRRRR